MGHKKVSLILAAALVLAVALTAAKEIKRKGKGVNQQATKALSITIAGLAPTLTSITPDSAVTNAVALEITATGTNFSTSSQVMWATTPLVTVCASSTSCVGTVPAGLYAAAGTFPISISTPAKAASASIDFTVVDVLAVSTTSLPDGTVGVAYSATLAATGGIEPYTWKVTTGSLPPGLAISGDKISGTPTVAGLAPFTVTVTDAGGGGVPPTPSDDKEIIVVPNPSFSINDGQSKPLSAIGNVTGQPVSAQWSLSPSGGNASLSTSSGSTTTFACTSNGHTGSPYTITATSAGLTNGTTSGNCLAAGSETLLSSTDCTPNALNAAWGQMTAGAYVIQLPNPCPTSEQTTKWQPAQPPAAVTSITLKGGTTVNCTGTAGDSNYACTPTDGTVITDSIAGYDGPWAFNFSVNKLRISGITFQGGSVTINKANGFIIFGGSSPNFRFDHNHTNIRTYKPAGGGGGFTMYGAYSGVADHNKLDSSYQINGFRVYTSATGGSAHGDGSWAVPTNLGSPTALYIENNHFDAGFVNDCNYGAREVVRYNMIVSQVNDAYANSGAVQMHVMGQGTQRERSCRYLEVYHNYFRNPTPSYPQYSSGDINAGTGIRFGNVMTGYNFSVVTQEMREVATTHYQTAAPNGIGYCGPASDGNNAPWDGNSGLHSGGWPCISQTGRGQGDLMSGDFPNMMNTVTGCKPNAASSPPSCNAWPREKLEPWYVWMESGYSNGIINYPCWSGVCRNANLDVFTTNTACQPNGCTSLTTGVGWGTVAQRPTSCTAGPGGTYGQSPTGSYGVGYWATDQNILYVCTAANVWTNVYTPYAYPHPLTLQMVTAEAAPFDWTPVIWIALLALAVAIYFLRKPILKRFAKKGPDA